MKKIIISFIIFLFIFKGIVSAAEKKKNISKERTNYDAIIGKWESQKFPELYVRIIRAGTDSYLVTGGNAGGFVSPGFAAPSRHVYRYFGVSRVMKKGPPDPYWTEDVDLYIILYASKDILEVPSKGLGLEEKWGNLLFNRVKNKEDVTTGVEVGNTAPDFSLFSTAGESYRLKELGGKKAVLLVFWTTWCPYDIQKIHELNKIYQEYYEKGLEVWAINIKEDKDKVINFISKKGIKYKVLLDSTGDIADLYKV